ncbi:MAG: hypothetical protein ACRDOI_40130 [Trebonia sp.]
MTGSQSLDGLPPGKRPALPALAVIGGLETASLAALVVNLAVGNNQQIAQMLGPAHGTLYLAGIALTWTATRLTRARLLSVIPVAGSLLAALAIRSASRSDDQHRREDQHPGTASSAQRAE